MRLMLSCLIVGGAAFLLPLSAAAGGRCGCGVYTPPRTLLEDYRHSAFVVVGKLTNSREAPAIDGPAEGHLADIDIEKVLKPHSALSQSRKVTFPSDGAANGGRFLIFCTFEKGKVVPFRAEPVGKKSELLNYLAGVIERKDVPVPQRLAFSLEHLRDTENSIALDAYVDLTTAEPKHLAAMARKLDRKRLRSWLENPWTPRDHVALYAELLGHCGKAAEDGEFLRRLFENANSPGTVTAILVAYVLLQPKEGWDFLENGALTNPKQDFLPRYGALRALRLIWENHPDLVDRASLIRAELRAAEFPDVADFVFEDLRKWKRWETTDQVLALARHQSHEVGVIRRAALRFALQSPTRNAAAYVAAERLRDSEMVQDTEEILELERRERLEKSQR